MDEESDGLVPNIKPPPHTPLLIEEDEAEIEAEGRVIILETAEQMNGGENETHHLKQNVKRE